MVSFRKRRSRPVPGSIPDVLQMFVAEVRFYREIAPVVGVRVPACFEAVENDGATSLQLEDLSMWTAGADPSAAARTLAVLHERWQGVAADRWPWLRTPDAAAELVGSLFDETWPLVVSRSDCTPAVRVVGERIFGRLPAVVRAAAAAGPFTLVHGDASMRNLRTSPSGEIALLDWEDVGVGPGVGDLAWLLLSSVEPARWNAAVAAYGTVSSQLGDALLSAASQAILSFADTPVHSAEAAGWVERLEWLDRHV